MFRYLNLQVDEGKEDKKTIQNRLRVQKHRNKLKKEKLQQRESDSVVLPLLLGLQEEAEEITMNQLRVQAKFSTFCNKLQRMIDQYSK
jgi:molecular chaperone GrpE (heat shock protein)